MARGDSIIRVLLIGDAKKLVGALGQADAATGGLLKSAAKTFVALGAVREGFQFLGDSTREADRLADAQTRLNIQLGDMSAVLVANADGYRKLGASTQDILELEATFADMATGAGLADSAITAMAEQVAATATAASLLGDVDAETIVSAIGRASQDSIKPLLALGVSMTDAEVQARGFAMTGKTLAGSLTEGELAAARIAIALEQLKPKLLAATEGTAGLEEEQLALDAAAEELQAKLGGPLSDALAAVLGFINDEIDALDNAAEGFQMLGKVIEDFARYAGTPLGNVADLLRTILDLLGSVGNGLSSLNLGGAHLSDSDISAAQRRERERNGLSGSMGNP